MAKERKASVIYEGNASQLVYAFPFDYLRKKFVKVEDIYTNSTELTMGVDYTVEDKQVRLVKGIPLGHSVKIYRETTTDPLVEWQDASVLRSADLSLQEVQLLHLAEETADKVFDSGMSTAYDNPNCWDGQYKRIINALDPIEDGDVVTLRYIKANQDSLLNQLKNTGAAQNSSIVSTGDAQNARLTATGDKQNTRLTSTGDTQNKRLTDTGDSYVSTMTTLKNTATDKATEATNQAALAKKWAVSDTSPDGATDSKSAKTWAENAKASASSSASSASASASSAAASQTSASSSASSASTASQKASAASSSASASATSAANASTSATNAKTSETKAAASAAAAAQSAENAKTWDPTYYTKTIQFSKEDNNGNNVLILLEQITDYDTYNYHRCGGSFSIYPYVRVGVNHQLAFPPVHCSLSLPYNTSTNDGYIGWTTNATYVPLVVKNNTTNKIYWGISVKGSGHTALIFGAFEHNIYVIDKLLSSSATDTYDGWTVLQTAEIKTLAEKSEVDDVLTKQKGYLALSNIGKKVVEDEGITDLNAVEFLSYPSWYCRLSVTIAKLQNCPTHVAFHLFNFSNSDNNGDLSNLKDNYYYIIQVLIDISGNIWRRCAFNSASTKFNFTAWAKSAVTSDLPTKTSQLTNDSGFAVISNGHLVINGSELWIE